MDTKPEPLDPPAVYFDLIKYDNNSLATPFLPLHIIFPIFAPGVEPECILNGGAQVVVMWKDIWEQLRAPTVENKAIPMESVNTTTMKTLGLIENHPVQLGQITCLPYKSPPILLFLHVLLFPVSVLRFPTTTNLQG